MKEESIPEIEVVRRGAQNEGRFQEEARRGDHAQGREWRLWRGAGAPGRPAHYQREGPAEVRAWNSICMIDASSYILEVKQNSGR